MSAIEYNIGKSIDRRESDISLAGANSNDPNAVKFLTETLEQYIPSITIARYRKELEANRFQPTRSAREQKISDAVDKFCKEIFPTIDGGFLSPKDIHNGYLAVTREVNSRVYPGYPHFPGIPNEVIYYNNDFAGERLHFLLNPNADENLKREIVREISIGLTYAQIVQRTHELGVHRIAQRITSHLDDSFWIGNPGQRHELFVYADHNDRTNKITKLYENTPNNSPSRADHRKLHKMSVRQLDVKGLPPYVIADVRNKPPTSATIKALRKASSNGGSMHLDDGVSDLFGGLFVIPTFDQDDDLERSTRLRDALVMQMSDIIPISDMDYDPAFNLASKNETRECAFHRWQIYFQGMGKVPFELIIYPNLSQYLNSRGEIRKSQYDNNITGRAHDLYRLGDIGKVAPYLFSNPGQAVKDVVTAKEWRAFQLLNENNVDGKFLTLEGATS